jgi:hypothetical protein
LLPMMTPTSGVMRVPSLLFRGAGAHRQPTIVNIRHTYRVLQAVYLFSCILAVQ